MVARLEPRRTSRRAVLLHERQAGCLAFRIDPPRGLTPFGDGCEPGGAVTAGFAYLGAFVEQNALAAWIRFSPADEAPERRLPPPL
jgi:hypothetical protein